MSNLRIDCHLGADAVRRLQGLLTGAGLLPAPLLEMEPDYLAAGFEGESPAALVASRGAEPVAYLPFIIRPEHLPLKLGARTLARLPCRQLRIFGVHSQGPLGADLLDPLLAHLLEHAQWDVADIMDFPAGTGLYDYLAAGRFPSGRQLHVKNQRFEPLHIDIAGTYEEYALKTISGKTRYNFKRKRRLLSERAGGKLELRLYTAVDHVDEFLKQGERIAVRTYQNERGLATVNQGPAMRKRVLFVAEKGWLRSYVLFVGDHPCAYCYGILYNGCYLHSIVGFDRDFQEFSPGNVLLCMMLEDLFASGLARDLDFGLTAAEYKETFYTSKQAVFYSRLYAPRAHARLLWGVERSWDVVRSRAVGLARKTPGARRWVRKQNYTER